MTVINASELAAIDFKPDLAPVPNGVYDAVAWVEDDEDVTRWLANGAAIQTVNFGFEDQFGVWTEDWCAAAASIVQDKQKQRPAYADLKFTAKTMFAWDQNACARLHDEELSEVRERARQGLAVNEQRSFETTFGTRLIADAADATTAADLVAAIGYLEEQIALAGVKSAVIHARPIWASVAASARLFQLRADGWHTPSGHLMVFGAGYIAGLANVLVATSPMYGWRGAVRNFESLTPDLNLFTALSERSVMIGYEKAIAAVDVTG
jgi:hypothetical protein